MLLAFVVAVAALGQKSRADSDEAAERGHTLAAAHCSVCHAIGADDPSPTAVNANTSFRRLPERFPIAMLVEAARSGSIAGHDEMPGFDFTMGDAHDLLSYIDSFAPVDKKYLTR